MQSWSRPKDPNDIRYLGFDWSRWLNDTRTSITTSEFIHTGSIVIDETEILAGVTTFRVTGGTAGEAIKITNRVTFDNGEQVDDTNTLRVREN